MENNKDAKGMLPSLLRGFIDTMSEDVQQGVKESLDDIGFWRKHQEIVPSLYYSNSLMRCFLQKKPRV